MITNLSPAWTYWHPPKMVWKLQCWSSLAVNSAYNSAVIVVYRLDGQECRIGVQHGRQPPAQLGSISVGISVTTWGARHHGNIAVADDSCAGPPPLHSILHEWHHGNTGQPPSSYKSHFLTPLNSNLRPILTPNCNFYNKLLITPNCNFYNKLLITPNCNFS